MKMKGTNEVFRLKNLQIKQYFNKINMHQTLVKMFIIFLKYFTLHMMHQLDKMMFHFPTF